MCVEIVGEETAAEAKKLVKALSLRGGGMVGTVVPFAEAACDIARRLERLSECDFIAMHHFEAVRSIDHMEPRMMPPGE